MDIRDVVKGALLAFTQGTETVGGKRFILNASVKPTKPTKLNNMVKKIHPDAKGMTGGPTIESVFVWLGQHVPFLRKTLGYKEYWEMATRQFIFDNALSKSVLGIGDY